MVYTYYLFWFCILYAIYKELYEYSVSFFVLFLTSNLIYNRPPNEYLYYMDRIAISLVVFVGFIYYMRRTTSYYIPVLCVVLIIIVYYTNIIVSPLKNEIVHVLTVIGHLSVMFHV